VITPQEEGAFPVLIVKNKKKQLTITPFTNIIKAGKKANEEIRLNSVIVYVDANNTFYLPKSLADYLK
jgi:alkaline phosphatase